MEGGGGGGVGWGGGGGGGVGVGGGGSAGGREGSNGLPAVSCQQGYLIIILCSLLCPFTWCYRRGEGGGSYIWKVHRVRCAPGSGCGYSGRAVALGKDLMYCTVLSSGPAS
jgi:hypothetical protein